MTAVRRVALLVALLPLLAGCGGGGGTPPVLDAGPHHVDVGSPALIRLKKQTDVPDCPQVASTRASGGMPAVTLPCLGGGRSVDLAGLRGPMIVNFWASWCGDCRQEMPALAAYARSHPGVKVVGVDYADQQPGAALALAGRSHVGYPLVADVSQALDHQAPLPHLVGLPFNAFVDAHGKVVHEKFGAMLTEADVASAAHTYLGVGG